MNIGRKKIIWISGAIIFLIVALFIRAGVFDRSTGDISSYQECVNAGYPVMESYPEQCQAPGGIIFVREIGDDASPITINGKVVCLPHRDVGGPVTFECAFGLLSGDGNYYELRDSNPGYPIVAGVPDGSAVRISGLFTPGEHRIYDSIGTIEIINLEILE